MLTGNDITRATAENDTQGGAGWVILIDFTPAASDRWTSFTANHIGTATAIVLDGSVLTCEVIQGAITGTTQISGNFSKEQATSLASAVRQAMGG